MKKYLRFLFAAACLGAIAGVVWVRAGRGVEIEVIEVKRGRIAREVRDVGYVEPKEVHKIYAPRAARVAKVLVEVGDRVSAGQGLVILEDPELDIRLVDMEAQLSQAASEVTALKVSHDEAGLKLKDAEESLSRLEKLVEAGAAPRTDYDRARLETESLKKQTEGLAARLDAASRREEALRQELAALRQQRNELVLKSPAGGTVLERPAEEGLVVGAGTLLAVVGREDLLEVRVDVLEEDMAWVKEGQPAYITAGVLGDTVLKGKVEKIHPQAVEKISSLGVAQRRVPVVVSLEKTLGLRPGYEVDVSIQTLVRDNVVLVPREAATRDNEGKAGVMVVEDGRLVHRQVVTGISDRMNVEILQGLVEGEKVVRDASLNLPEGKQVRPVLVP